MIFFSDNSKRVQQVEGFSGGGGGDLWNVDLFASRGGLPLSRGGGQRALQSPLPASQQSVAPAQRAPIIDFDFDLSQIGQAIRRGNTEADIRSAYEVFTTGTSRGRGLGYAQDVQRRFGAPSIRHAAASYLDAAGLPRLARIVSPTPEPLPGLDGEFFGLPPDPRDAPPVGQAQRSPVELLLDALPRLFGQATYNPPLQAQATGYTPVSGDFGGGAGVGSNIGVWLLLGAAAIAAYFIYKRYKGSAGG